MIVFVGRVTRDKGITELVEAFLAVHATRPDLALLLVGPFEPDRDPLPAATLEAIHSHPAIHGVGFCLEPERYLAAGDLFCLPSYREGFGTVAIEAGALGLPVVATRVTGLVDAVVDAETGRLVPAKDVPRSSPQSARCSTLRRSAAGSARRAVGARSRDSTPRSSTPPSCRSTTACWGAMIAILLLLVAAVAPIVGRRAAGDVCPPPVIAASLWCGTLGLFALRLLPYPTLRPATATLLAATVVILVAGSAAASAWIGDARGRGARPVPSMWWVVAYAVAALVGTAWFVASVVRTMPEGFGDALACVMRSGPTVSRARSCSCSSSPSPRHS